MGTPLEPNLPSKYTEGSVPLSCQPWTGVKEKILFDLKLSHPYSMWSDIRQMYNRIIISWRQRTVDGLYAKWKTVKNKYRDDSFMGDSKNAESTDPPNRTNDQLYQDASVVRLVLIKYIVEPVLTLTLAQYPANGQR